MGMPQCVGVNNEVNQSINTSVVQNQNKTMLYNTFAEVLSLTKKLGRFIDEASLFDISIYRDQF